MPSLGIIGAGQMGTAIARLAVAAGIPVVISNSRGPESLNGLIAELGPLATTGTVEQASEQDLVVLAVPLTAHQAIPAEPLRGKTLLDTSNYYPYRDGRIAELDENAITTSELIQRHFEGANLVKAFSNINAPQIPPLARPSDAPDRTTLPIASNNPQAAREAIRLIEQLGFDAIDAGPLAESWRFEPEAAAYTNLYLAEPSKPDNWKTDPGRPVSEAELRSALSRAVRVDAAQRTV